MAVVIGITIGEGTHQTQMAGQVWLFTIMLIGVLKEKYVLFVIWLIKCNPPERNFGKVRLHH